MPTYCFECPDCGSQVEITRRMEDSGTPWECGCGVQMERDFTAEHSSVRGDYEEPIVMGSMAFDAKDVAEHRRRFPGVDLVIDHERSARPVMKSLSQKRAYMKARGWVDRNAFV